MVVLIVLLMMSGNLSFLATAATVRTRSCDSIDKVVVEEYTYRRSNGDHTIDCDQGRSKGHLTGISYTVIHGDVSFNNADNVELCRKITDDQCCNVDDFVTFASDGGWDVVRPAKFAGKWILKGASLGDDLYGLIECNNNNELGDTLTCGENGRWNDMDDLTYLCSCEEGQYRKIVDGKPVCGKICGRGTILQDNKCSYCPAGYTTYPDKPNECWGPQLYGYDFKYGGSEIVSFLVSQRLGEVIDQDASSPIYWTARGNWKVYSKSGRVRQILEKYTLGFYRDRKNKAKDVIKVVPLVKNVFCWSMGEKYVGYRNESVCGLPCTRNNTFGNSNCRRVANVSGWVCYCSNKSDRTKEPSCWTDQGDQPCGIPECYTGTDRTVEPRDDIAHCVTDTSYPVGLIPGGLGFTAVYNDRTTANGICDRLGRECQGVWVDELDIRLSDKVSDPAQDDQGDREMFLKKDECSSYHEYYFEQKQPNISRCH